MIKIAIDFGSSVTKIYRADTNNGIVLAEPSCVAVVGEENQIRAIGKEAKNLIGKTSEYTNIYYPIQSGEIVDMPLAVAMLKEFLLRIGVKGGLLRRTQALFSVPCGANERVLAGYRALVEECGLKKACFVEQPYLAALGAGVVIEGDPVFCLDIGGGVSNAAVVSADGLISGLSINVGGNNMDYDVIAKIAEEKQLYIGALTAERVKIEIASLERTARGSVLAEGSSTETYQPASIAVQADEITDCVKNHVRKICDYAVAVLWNLPAEVAAAVNRNGVYLSGGILKIPGVGQYIAERLNMRRHVCEEPQFTTVLGGGVLLQEKSLLHRFSKKFD